MGRPVRMRPMDWDEHRNLILEVILGVVVLILLVVMFVSTTGGGGHDNASDVEPTTTTVEETTTTGTERSTTTSSSTSTTAIKATVKSVFAPWSSDGATPVVDVKTRSSGECFAESSLVDGAYRCFIGNEVQDPCFPAPTSGDKLACAVDPWSDISLLTLTGQLPDSSSSGTNGSAWAIELQNGDRCTGATGTATSVKGVSMVFRCKSGGLASEAITSTQPWTVQYAADEGVPSLAPMNVATRW